MNADAQLPTVVSTPLMDPDSFGHMQRVANILAMSPLFPEHLRKGSKEAAIANGVLVMNMAMRLNEDPLTVAQNIYFVGGKPGWSASYMISKANQHGVFKNPIDWIVKGRGTDNLSVTAVAELSGTGKQVEITCDMAMAKADGWTKNAKYQSMPEQMLRYRSATFLIRLYCPEVMVGVPATIELEANTMKDITPDEEAEIYRDREGGGGPSDQKSQTDWDRLKKEEAEGVEPEKDEGEPEVDPSTAKVVEAKTAQGGDGSGEQIDREPWVKLKEMIVNDLADAPNVKAVTDLYGAQIDQMAKKVPDLHKELVAEFEAFGKEQG